MKVYETIKISGLSVEESLQIAPLGTILLGYVGSIAHGTFVPSDDPYSIDDKDLMGVCIAPESVYIGLNKFEQREKKFKEWDSVVYEIRKYFSLLLKCNPNVMSLLWLNKENYIHVGTSGKKLLDNRDIFVSKKAYHSFVGYAHGQLHRMEHNACEGYMGDKRKKLVEKFGYDTKNAAHLVRLLCMGIEFLTEGKLYVHRHDAEQLKSIKRGEWSLEKIKSHAEELFSISRESYIKSSLPSEPDTIKAESLLMEIIKEELNFT